MAFKALLCIVIYPCIIFHSTSQATGRYYFIARRSTSSFLPCEAKSVILLLPSTSRGGIPLLPPSERQRPALAVARPELLRPEPGRKRAPAAAAAAALTVTDLGAKRQKQLGAVSRSAESCQGTARDRPPKLPAGCSGPPAAAAIAGLKFELFGLHVRYLVGLYTK